MYNRSVIVILIVLVIDQDSEYDGYRDWGPSSSESLHLIALVGVKSMESRHNVCYAATIMGTLFQRMKGER